VTWPVYFGQGLKEGDMVSKIAGVGSRRGEGRGQTPDWLELVIVWLFSLLSEGRDGRYCLAGDIDLLGALKVFTPRSDFRQSNNFRLFPIVNL